MSRVLTIRICDSSDKDLLECCRMIESSRDDTFYDVLAEFPDDVARRDLMAVRLFEFPNSDASESTRISGNMLQKTFSELDEIMQRLRITQPVHAIFERQFSLTTAFQSCTERR